MMMKKPELLATAGSMDELKQLLEAGADAILIGEKQFGLRLPGSFTLEEMKQAVSLVHEKGKKLYVAVNALFHNEKLEGLADYLKKLSDMGVDAIEYADPAVLMSARVSAPDLVLHWNPEIIATSSHTVNYWAAKGIKRAWLSRELNMDEILAIKEETDVEIGVQVHGVSCIFHSKRPLVHSYFEHQGKEAEKESKHVDRGLYLREEKREDIAYPIYEDESGTHIMSSEDICIIENLDELMDHGVDSMRIEGLLKAPEYNATVVKAYRTAIDLYAEDPDAFYDQVDQLKQNIEEKQDPNRPLSTGFFYKELVF